MTTDRAEGASGRVTAPADPTGAGWWPAPAPLEAPGPAEQRDDEPEQPRRGPVARMRRALFGLRTRLLVWYVILLAVAGVVTIVATRYVLIVRLEEQIESQLIREIEELEVLAAGNNPATGEPFNDDVEAIFETFLSRSVPSEHETFLAYIVGGEGLRSAGPVPYRLDLDAKIAADLASIREPERAHFEVSEVGRVDYHAVTLEAGDEPLGVFVVAAFSGLAREEVDDVVEVAAAILGGTLLLVSLVAWGAAGRVVAPITAVTDTARRISDSDLTRRITETGAEEAAEMAATFNAMLDRLEAGFSMQRRFVDDAGHELRTPITIIRGHLDLLGDDPRERAETLALVDDELERMHRMVEDLLMLARAERPDFLNLEVVDVATLTGELFSKAGRLGSRGWRLEATGSGRIVADRQRLTQAVMQLAQNATQHTVPGGSISIGSEVADGTALFWVADDGEGVPDAEQEHVFERFHRGIVGRRRSEGAGLGLSIVQAIAEAHGGTIELASTPGHGATFTISMPVDPPQERPATES